MKRFFVLLAMLSLPLALLPPLALASPELAEEWGSRAASLYDETEDMLATSRAGYISNTSDAFVEKLASFSVTASRLGSWIDRGEGPSDYGCIFRGMAEEAELQLVILEDTSDFTARHQALKRLATLLDDAQSIAVASAYSVRTGSNAATNAPASCLANLASIDQYLTEQP